MRLDLVGGELDQVELMWGRTWWGRTRHVAKLAATFEHDSELHCSPPLYFSMHPKEKASKVRVKHMGLGITHEE